MSLLWTVLRNYKLIWALVSSIKASIEYAIKNKSKPPQDMILSSLDAVEALLDSGVIDIPNVDEKQISEGLKFIEEKIKGG